MHQSLVSQFKARSLSESTEISLRVPFVREPETRSGTAPRIRQQNDRQMAELSSEALLICCEEQIIFANREAARALGTVDSSTLCGRSVLDFIDPAFHSLFQERALAASACRFQEIAWRRMDGTRMDAEIGLFDVHFEGKPALQLVVRDIGARKCAEGLQLAQNGILNMIATGAGLHEVLVEIAGLVEHYSQRGLCSILLLDENSEAFRERVAPSLPTLYLERIGMAHPGPCSGSCGTAVFRREPVIVTDIATDPLWKDRAATALEYGLRACTSWPIFGSDTKVLGSFALYFHEPVAPKACDLELFSVCTRLAGIAIERHAAEERIRLLAHFDGLTGLPNHFLFKEYLDLALRSAPRRNRQFAVLFLDLDRFKEINDTLGHDAGDAALREIALRLRRCLRESDKIARMGGDEFYILLEDLGDGRHAGEVARKLVEAAARPLQLEESGCSLGASIGIALYPQDGTDGKTLLMNADSAMYRAKEAGRKGYCFHSPPAPPKKRGAQKKGPGVDPGLDSDAGS